MTRATRLLALLCLAAAGCPAPKPAACACLPGETCVGERCLPAACGTAKCRSGQGCLDGECRDVLCLDTQCEPGKRCAGGACYPIDCEVLSCAPGDVCVDGACLPGNCVGVVCTGQAACADGRCVSTVCGSVTCGGGAVCDQGNCVQAACVGVICSAGTACVEGRCVPTSCAGLICPAGEACVNEQCVDPACVGVRCANGTSCLQGSCRAEPPDAGAPGLDASAGADAAEPGPDAAEPADAGQALDAAEPPDAASPGPDAAEPADAAVQAPDARPTITLVPASTSLISGEPLVYGTSDGTLPFTEVTLTGGGAFDLGIGAFFSRPGVPPFEATLELTDADGALGTGTVSVAGFVQKAELPFPKSGDDGFLTPNSAAWFKGAFYLSTVGFNTPGWELTYTYRYDLQGTATPVPILVDSYIEFPAGEEHVMSTTATADAIYQCGYSWVSPGFVATEWFVRKSTDGVHWTTSERYLAQPNDTLCWAIKALPSDPNTVYALGELRDGATYTVLRASHDAGATWATEATIPALYHSNARYDMDVGPDGAVWVVGRVGQYWSVFRGTNPGGIWTFTGTSLSAFQWADNQNYEAGAYIAAIDDQTAIVSAPFVDAGTRWKILQTTDQNSTWTERYGSAFADTMVAVSRLAKVPATGDLLAAGSVNAKAQQILLRSSDKGGTWAEIPVPQAAGLDEYALAASPDGTQIFVGQEVHPPRNDMRSLTTTDSGANWTVGYNQYQEVFWSTVDGATTDSAGRLWAFGWAGSTLDHAFESVAVFSSEDGGYTWSRHLYSVPTAGVSADAIASAPSGGIHLLVSSWDAASASIVRSTDGGATWTVPYTIAGPSTLSPYAFFFAPDGTGYLLASTPANSLVSHDGGASWESLTTFTLPGVTAPYTLAAGAYNAAVVRPLADSSLVLARAESCTAPCASRAVLYRSTNQGATWAEAGRIDGVTGAPPVYLTVSRSDTLYWGVLDTRGTRDVLVVEKSPDHGASWAPVVERTVGFAVDGLLVDDAERLFVHSGASVYAFDSAGEPFLVKDFSVNPDDVFGSTDATPYVCDGVLCAFRYHEQVAIGSRNYFFSLDHVDAAPNSAPVAADTAVGALRDAPFSFTLPYADADGDGAFECEVSGLDQLFAVERCTCIGGVCTATLCGAPGFTGTGHAAYRVRSRGLWSNLATATVTVL